MPVLRTVALEATHGCVGGARGVGRSSVTPPVRPLARFGASSSALHQHTPCDGVQWRWRPRACPSPSSTTAWSLWRWRRCPQRAQPGGRAPPLNGLRRDRARVQYPQRSSRVGALNALLHDWLLPLLGPAGAQGHEEPQSDPADTLAPPEAAMSPGGSLGRVGSSSLLLGHSQRRELGAAPPVGPQRPLYSMPKVVRPASRGSPQERASTEAGSPPPAEDAQTPSPPPPPPPQPSPADGPVSAGAQARTVQWWDPPPVPASRLRRPPQVFTSGTTMHPPNEDWAAQVRSYYQPGPHRPRDRSALPRAEGVSGSSPAGPLRHGRSLAASSASTPSLHTAGYVQRLHAPPLDLARDPLPSSAGGVPHANDQPASTVAGRKAPFPDAVGAGQGRGRKQQRQQKRWQQRQQQRQRQRSNSRDP